MRCSSVSRLIELGSPSARFVADMATRELGYCKIAVGVYQLALTPVGSPPPPAPTDPEFKPALGFFLWNPIFGEVRFETNAAILRQTIDGFWNRYRTFSEASRGLQPVIDFAGRREVPVKKRGTPVIDIVGWTLGKRFHRSSCANPPSNRRSRSRARFPSWHCRPPRRPVI